MNYQKLFNYMSEEHGVTLLETDMQEIVRIVNEMQDPIKVCTGCGHRSDVELKPTALACCPDSNYIEQNNDFFYCKEESEVGYKCEDGPCDRCKKTEQLK